MKIIIGILGFLTLCAVVIAIEQYRHARRRTFEPTTDEAQCDGLVIGGACAIAFCFFLSAFVAVLSA